MIFIQIYCIIKMVKLMKEKYRKLIINELIIILLIILIYFIANTKLINLVPNCVINDKFNILCPSCGATRCILNIFKLEFITAFLYNPLIFILIIYFFIFNLVYIYNTITDKKLFYFLYSKKVYILLIIVIILFTIFINIL